MNTTNRTRFPMLDPSKEWIFCLEGYELAFDKATYESIKGDWNKGKAIEVIAAEYTRDPTEIIIALIDMVLKGHKVRPMARLL